MRRFPPLAMTLAAVLCFAGNGHAQTTHVPANFATIQAALNSGAATIYVADVSQRSGIGRLLYEALVDTLTAQGFTQAMGVIALPNDGSIKLHEAVGFRRAGVFREVGHKHGRWIDVGYWQRELAEPAAHPAEPKRFADVGVVRDPVAVKHR